VVKRTPTSINVDEDLWKKAKMEAIKRGITVTELFEKALEKEIDEKIKYMT
jgi:post-segregation antitoxin (ccd killing protein)